MRLPYYEFYIAARSDVQYDPDDSDDLVLAPVVEKGVGLADLARSMADEHCRRLRSEKLAWCRDNREQIADAGGDARLAWSLHLDGCRDGLVVAIEDWLVQELIELLDGQDQEDDEEDEEGDEEGEEDDEDEDVEGDAGDADEHEQDAT